MTHSTGDQALLAAPVHAQERKFGPRIPRARPEHAAISGLLGLCLALFGPHVLGLTTFVGNSDRLHTFLNMRLLEVNGLQQLGRVPGWNDAMFMGIPTFGFHWMLMALDPVAIMVALFPAQDLLRVSGYVAAGHVMLAALAAYLLIRDVVKSPFAAVVGAGLYVCSAFAVHRISQVDPAFDVQIFAPLGIWILRRVRPGRVVPSFLGMTGVIVGLVGFTFLQEAAYILIFFGLYACFRSVRCLDWRPIVVLGAAGLTGLLVAAPRLGTVAADILETSRSSALLSTCPCEVLRWFDDGIFGRFPQEALALSNGINLHEGNQLYTSVFAALLVVAGLLRPRGIVSVLAGGGFLVTLVLLAKPIIDRSDIFYGLLATAVVLTGWALVRPLVGRAAAMPRRARGRDWDVPFFTVFVAIAFAVVLSDTVRYWIYVAFLRIDFSHSRISAAALLPLCLLIAVVISELFGDAVTDGHQPARRSAVALASGALLAIIVLVVLDFGAGTIAAALFGPIEKVRIGTWIYVSTRELGYIVGAGVILSTLLAVNWLARHVDVINGGQRARLGWRQARLGNGWATARLVPPYLIGCLALFHGFSNAYLQINGSHTQTYPRPFFQNNNFTAPTSALRTPSPELLRAVHVRLESDDFRSIVVSAADGFPTYGAASEHGFTAYLAEAWQLRLVEGYPNLPRRLGELPWPDSVRSLRSLYFAQQDRIPWPLLSILNVKYALIASPSLMFNVPSTAGSRGEAGLDDLQIVENPLPVTPRAFFAQRIVPRVQTPPPTRAAVPNAPRVMDISAPSPGALLLGWTDDNPEATYRIYRRQILPTPEPEAKQLGETGRGGRSFLNPGLDPAASYEYQLQACDGRGCGEKSDAVVAQAAIDGVAVPRDVAAEARPNGQAIMTWAHDDPNAAMLVELLTPEGVSTARAVRLPPGARSHTWTDLLPLTPYGVRVRACTSAGCSPDSATQRLQTLSSLTAADLRGQLPLDPAQESVVDGLDAPRDFGSTTGSIQATYQGDRVRVRIDPADAERFLVLNELYHPGWHAYAGGTELQVWPTNIVMRGVIVPAGVSELTLRFVPFFVTPLALGCVIAGLLVGMVSWRALKHLDTRSRATRGSPVEPPSSPDASRVGEPSHPAYRRSASGMQRPRDHEQEDGGTVSRRGEDWPRD